MVIVIVIIIIIITTKAMITFVIASSRRQPTARLSKIKHTCSMGCLSIYDLVSLQVLCVCVWWSEDYGIYLFIVVEFLSRIPAPGSFSQFGMAPLRS